MAGPKGNMFKIKRTVAAIVASVMVFGSSTGVMAAPRYLYKSKDFDSAWDTGVVQKKKNGESYRHWSYNMNSYKPVNEHLDSKKFKAGTITTETKKLRYAPRKTYVKIGKMTTSIYKDTGETQSHKTATYTVKRKQTARIYNKNVRAYKLRTITTTESITFRWDKNYIPRISVTKAKGIRTGKTIHIEDYKSLFSAIATAKNSLYSLR